MPFTPEQEAQAFEIARARKLRWRWTKDDTCIAVQDVKGAEPTGIAGSEADDPVSCLLLAEQIIRQGQQREAETRAARLFDALRRGVYVPWPRTIANGPNAGQMTWLVLQASDRAQVGQQHAGLMGALVEIARLVNEPAPLPDDGVI